MLLGLFAVSLAFSGFGETITTTSSILHEKRGQSDENHLRRGMRVARDSIIPVRIALVQSNLEHGYRHLMDVATPTSANYGKHWLADDVNMYFAPSETAFDAVEQWIHLSEIDIKTMTRSKTGWLALDLRAQDAEKLLQTEYYEYEDTDGTIRIGSDLYHLPEHVARHVDFVTPGVVMSHPLRKHVVKRAEGTDFLAPYIEAAVHGPLPAWDHASPEPSNEWLLPEDLRNCGKNMTPTCIKALYNLPQAHRNDSINSLGIYENSLLDVYAQEDLDSFFARYAPYVPQGSHPVLRSIDGGEAPVALESNLNTGESDIDLDIAFSLLYPQVRLAPPSSSLRRDTDLVISQLLSIRLPGLMC